MNIRASSVVATNPGCTSEATTDNVSDDSTQKRLNSGPATTGQHRRVTLVSTDPDFKFYPTCGGEEIVYTKHASIIAMVLNCVHGRVFTFHSHTTN